MKNKMLCLFVLTAFAGAPAFAGDEPTMLVYPTAAAQTELDNSTPAKRITPPVREDTEYDPVTPIGQINGIVTTLNALTAGQEAIKENQSSLAEVIGKLQLGENKDLLPLLERGAKEQSEIAAKLDKLADVPQMITDLRASVESVEKTTANIKAIRQSRWTDFCVVAILTILLLQLVWYVVSTILKFIQQRAQMLEEYRQWKENRTNETKSVKKSETK